MWWFSSNCDSALNDQVNIQPKTIRTLTLIITSYNWLQRKQVQLFLRLYISGQQCATSSEERKHISCSWYIISHCCFFSQWVVLSKTYQSLHRLSANGMKLCGFVGLVHASIAVDLKSFKNLANRSKSGDKLESPSQKLTSGIFPF